MRSPWVRSGTRVRPLAPSDREDALRMLRRQPVTSILAAVHLESGRGFDGAQLLGVEMDGELRAVCWSGANTVPVGELSAMAPLAAHLRRRGRRCSSIVGSATLVDALWDELQDSWAPPREVRGLQPALLIDHPPAVPSDARVRRAQPEDFGVLFPASVAMFTEEVGYDPTRTGGGYAHYVRGLVASSRSWLVVVDGAVVFKADIGALWDGLAQVQGVWVHPRWRGRGLGTAAMAGVVEQILAGTASAVSLYVNDYNSAARRVYEKVGFRPAGTYATILF
ncbi:MAG: GNAT family N-acetyltransferase [Actinomycetota bacterium]